MKELIAPGIEASERCQARAPTLVGEMSTPEPRPIKTESLELPVEELLRRAKPHPPYGEDVIDDLTPEEAEAFLAAVRS